LLTLLVPVSLFIAIVFTYNKLLADSELTVMRAVGLSRWQLAQPALIVASGAMIFCYFLSLYLMPLANRQFNDMRAFLRDNYTSVLLQEEVFNTPVDGLTIFVRERDSTGNLRGILVHDNRLPDNPITMMAEQGKLLQGERGPQFYLEQGIRQERRQGRVSWLNFDNYTLDVSFYTGIARARDRDEDEKYLGELLSESNDNPQSRAEAHQRIVWPLYNIALALFALAVLLNGEFSRRGQWKRIIMASAGSLLVALTGIGMRNLVVGHPMLTPLLYVTVAIIAAGSAFTLFATRSKPVPLNGDAVS
jgi:lipopolysaccharide export system permease protein